MILPNKNEKAMKETSKASEFFREYPVGVRIQADWHEYIPEPLPEQTVGPDGRARYSAVCAAHNEEYSARNI